MSVDRQLLLSDDQVLYTEQTLDARTPKRALVYTKDQLAAEKAGDTVYPLLIKHPAKIAEENFEQELAERLVAFNSPPVQRQMNLAVSVQNDAMVPAVDHTQRDIEATARALLTPPPTKQKVSSRQMEELFARQASPSRPMMVNPDRVVQFKPPKMAAGSPQTPDERGDQPLPTPQTTRYRGVVTEMHGRFLSEETPSRPRLLDPQKVARFRQLAQNALDADSFSAAPASQTAPSSSAHQLQQWATGYRAPPYPDMPAAGPAPEPIPDEVKRVVDEVKAMRRTFGGTPFRNDLRHSDNAHIREHFGAKGILRPDSALLPFAGDERLFSKDWWRFLTEQEKSGSYGKRTVDLASK